MDDIILNRKKVFELKALQIHYVVYIRGFVLEAKS